MSEKDKIIQLLDYVPEYKLGYVLAYVQGITADEDPKNDEPKMKLKKMQPEKAYRTIRFLEDKILSP